MPNAKCLGSCMVQFSREFWQVLRSAALAVVCGYRAPGRDRRAAARLCTHRPTFLVRLLAAVRVARRRHPVRSAFWTLAGGALFSTVILCFDATALLANSSSAARKSYNRMHREFTRTLAGMISHCVDVLAVHRPGSQGQATDPNSSVELSSGDGGVVLWMRDDVNPGQIDPHEIAIVTHSPLFRTIVVYTMAQPQEPTPADDSGVPIREFREWGPSAQPLPLDVVTNPAFCERWRMMSYVRPQIVGTGISDMSLTCLPGRTGELSLLRLTLTWEPDSSDGAGEASALIERGRKAM
jgi:hypothetical protein